MMNKINLILCLAVFLLMPYKTHAQTLSLRLGSDGIIEDAIKDAIVLVESSYCIKDVESNMIYGRNGRPHFNQLQFLGCKTVNGIITTNDVLQPWKNDDQFNKYRRNNKYMPLLDTILVARSLPLDTIENMNASTELKFNNDSTLICLGNNRTDGLTLSKANKKSTNWIVWVKKINDSENVSHLEYAIIKNTIDFKNQPSIDSPNSIVPYIGGFYISGNVINVGKIEFSLSGIMVNNLGKWELQPVVEGAFFSPRENECTDIKEPDTSTDDMLTPIIKDDKPKKKIKANKK